MRLSRHKLQLLSSALLLVGGFVGVAPYIYLSSAQRDNKSSQSVALAPKAPSVHPAQLISGQPRSVSIPGLNIALPLVPGSYSAQSQTWTLTKDKAQFATPSSLPNNQAGNTFVYGHNLKAIFGTLHLIKPGDEATITTENGYVFTYRYVGTFATVPSDTSIFDYTGAPILTIQTCSGIYSQNRQMYQFAYSGYRKA